LDLRLLGSVTSQQHTHANKNGGPIEDFHE
jgi:hypothetical protein